jgi:hypothetical protein
LGGDFKQTAPIAPAIQLPVRGRVDDHTRQWMASLQQSQWFNRNDPNFRHCGFTTFRLTQNQRVLQNPSAAGFIAFARKIGAGIEISNPDNNFEGRVTIPADMQATSMDDLINHVFPPAALRDLKNNLHIIKNNAILVPTNAEAERIEKSILDKIFDREYQFTSYDTPVDEQVDYMMAVNISDRCIENLNGKTPSGFPPHKLHIKKNQIVMLIQNISVENGLCNGTRMRVVEIGQHNILLAHIDGVRAERNETFVLPRIVFTTKEGDLKQTMGTVQWTRYQFPIRPGFVLTINKAQGQTMERVGIALDRSRPFAHGQLYVGVSRVRTRESLKLLLPPKMDSVNNVVQQRIVGQDDVDYARAEWTKEKTNCIICFFYYKLNIEF